MQTVTDQTWDAEVTKSAPPVLVMFGASWCAPCRAAVPMLDALAEKLGTRVRVLKADVEQAPAASNAAGVTSVPHFAVYQRGALVASHRGAAQASRLVDLMRAVGV